MKKRRITIAAIALCLAAIMACGTLAYFTAQGDIKNKFMTASFDPDHPDEPVTPDDVFSIKVFETDEDGEETTDGLTYDKIVPGDKLDKDPTVRNTGDNDAYLRVTVTVTKAAAWKRACAAHGIKDLEAIFGGFVKADWTRVDEPAFDSEADTLTYVYYYNKVLAAGDEATLFTDVTIPADFTQTDMATLAAFELKIGADAIQSQNTGDNAIEAFEKF